MEYTSTSPSDDAAHMPSIAVTNSSVLVNDLCLDDEAVATYLMQFPEEQRAGELMRAISLGVHGLVATGMQATVDEMTNEVRRILDAAAKAAESQLGLAVKAGRSELTAHLDPDVRSSLTARTVNELEAVHNTTLARLDPDRTDSHTGRLVAMITELLGPGGLLAQRLDEAFDATDTGQGLGRLFGQFERRLQEMRDLIVGEQHRAGEVERSTAKGFEFEDEVEAMLRKEARAIGGCVVERTAQQGGVLGAQAKVGDFTVMLGDGTTIVVEAKNATRIGLTGSTGILTELDQAMANRNASWSICVSHQDAYPSEVGGFAVYGNRILLVDGGDGTLIGVALRWITAAARSEDHSRELADTAAALDGLDRIRELAQQFSSSKRVLSTAQASLESVRTDLDSLRKRLLDLVDDAVRALAGGRDTARRVA
jgi:hypothetical protein